MRAWLQRFMMGRYGADDLNKFILIAAAVVIILSMFVFPDILYPISLALIIIGFFRMLSKNVHKRSLENQRYLQMTYKVRRWFSSRKSQVEQRDTHRFYSCPSCRTRLRVPRGKGRIIITCPKCRTTIEKIT